MTSGVLKAVSVLPTLKILANELSANVINNLQRLQLTKIKLILHDQFLFMKKYKIHSFLKAKKEHAAAASLENFNNEYHIFYNKNPEGWEPEVCSNLNF